MHSTRQDFLIVHAAVMPTSVFPAPHGSTIIPERARLGVSVVMVKHQKREKIPSPISKHFAQTRLLIWADDSGRLEIYIKIGIHGIITKIIFFQHWALELVAALFHTLESKEVQSCALIQREKTLHRSWHRQSQRRGHSRHLHQFHLAVNT